MIPVDASFLPQRKGIFLVGGSLRDLLLGRKPLDYDIAVQGDPLAFARDVAREQNGRLVFLGKPGQEIIRIILPHHVLDISGVKGAGIEADLKQRDFTINALAYEPVSQRLLDVCGAVDDLRRHRIRMLSPAVFKQDPLRLLRAFRLSASLDFEIDPATLSCIAGNAALICRSAGERIHDELFKILKSPAAGVQVNHMQQTGILFELFPEMRALETCARNRHHAYDGLTHTLATLTALEDILSAPASLFPEHAEHLKLWLTEQKRSLLKCAALWHDIGKPPCIVRKDGGGLSYAGHETTGADMADGICRRLRFSGQETRRIVFIIRNHLRPLSLFIARQRQTLTSKGIARFLMQCGNHAPAVLLHAAADMQAKKANAHDRETLDFIRFLTELIQQYFSRFLALQSEKPLISGRDLIHQLHLSPSPEFKTILSRVAEARLAGLVSDKQDALRLARAIARDRGALPFHSPG